MTKQELLRRSRQAIADSNALPPEERWRRLVERGTIDVGGEPLFAEDLLDGLPRWSDRNLRWLIDHIARLNNNGGQQHYTVMQRRACALRDERTSAGREIGDQFEAAGRFTLVGLEGHQFGRCQTVTDCYELAAQMGLGIVTKVDASEYFGHATVDEMELK